MEAHMDIQDVVKAARIKFGPVMKVIRKQGREYFVACKREESPLPARPYMTITAAINQDSQQVVFYWGRYDLTIEDVHLAITEADHRTAQSRRTASTYYFGSIDSASGDRKVYRVAQGLATELPARFDLRNHSPTGYKWGYGGSGPAQLAIALLADHLRDDAAALAHYQDFKWRVVAALPQNEEWTLRPEEIDASLASGDVT